MFSYSYEVSLSDDDADYGSAGSAHDNDVESNVSYNDAQSQGADSADSEETYVSGGRRPWTRTSRGIPEDEHKWETASLPSRWDPSPSASRARSVDRSRGKFAESLRNRFGAGFGASLRSRTAVAAQQSGLKVQHDEVFTDIRNGAKRKFLCLAVFSHRDLRDQTVANTNVVRQ